MRRAVQAAAALLALLVLFSGRHGLERLFLGGGPGGRTVYMKLPLEQPRFHWFFSDEAAMLRGSLDIEIHRTHGPDTLLTVFRDGRMTEGWEPISRDERGIYFGFMGGGPVWTAAGDSLLIRLTVVEDLAGIGAYRTGVLRRGDYEAVASYSNLAGHPSIDLWPRRDEPLAFVLCWRTKWSLEVTSERGWRGVATAEDDPWGEDPAGRFLRNAFASLGTDGFPCVE